MVKTRVRVNPHTLRRTQTKTIAASGGAGCLIATVFGFFWLLGVMLVLALKIGIVAAIIAGVYFIFTGDWIGNAAFLN